MSHGPQEEPPYHRFERLKFARAEDADDLAPRSARDRLYAGADRVSAGSERV